MTTSNPYPGPTRRRFPGLLAEAIVALAIVALPGQALARDDAAPAPGSIDDAQPFDDKAASELKFPDGTRWTPEVDVEAEPATTVPRSVATPNFRPSTRLATYTIKAGETLRTVAYRYCTSPVMVAMANQLPFDAKNDQALKTGLQVTVPIAYRAPSGFREAEQLVSGPGVQSLKADSNWGRPHFVHEMRALFGEMDKRWPSRHPAVAGSLSRVGGGRLGHHKSHRAGQDIDVGYFTFESNRKIWGKPRLDEIDYQRLWFFIDAAERTGLAAAIYMATDVQRRLYSYAAKQGIAEARLRTIFQSGPKGGRGDTLIRYAPGHRDHFHLRLLCPEDFKDMVGDRST